MALENSLSGENYAAGTHRIDVNEGFLLHQIAINGPGGAAGTGTVTVYVYVPGEVAKDGTDDEVIVGRLPITDPVWDLAVPQAPRLIDRGFVDAIEFVATGTFNWRIQSGSES